MRFCTKCGAQLLDEAVICTKCGCMVEGRTPPAAVKPPRQKADSFLEVKPANAPSMVLVIFHFLFSIFAVISLFWFAIALAENYLSADLNITKYSYSIYGKIRLEDEYVIPGLLAALAALSSALVGFIMTLVEKHRGERLFSSIAKLFAGVMLSVVAIYFIV